MYVGLRKKKTGRVLHCNQSPFEISCMPFAVLVAKEEEKGGQSQWNERYDCNYSVAWYHRHPPFSRSQWK